MRGNTRNETRQERKKRKKTADEETRKDGLHLLTEWGLAGGRGKKKGERVVLGS